MIRLSKSILDEPGWLGERFSKPMAWIDLLLLTDGEDGVSVSFRELANRWKWAVSTVIRFLDSLVAKNKIELSSETFRGTLSKHLIVIISSDYKDDKTFAKRSAKHSKNAPLIPPDSFPCSPTPSLTPSLSPLISPQEKEESPCTDVPGDEKRDKPASAPPDYQSILKLWNDTAKKGVPKIRGLSPSRKEKMKLRIEEMGGFGKAMETFAECFKKISASDFCNGTTGKWVATFDWFFANEKNWLKVLEGNYDNRKEKSPLEDLGEKIAMADAYYEQRARLYGASAGGDTAGGWLDGPDEQ